MPWLGLLERVSHAGAGSTQRSGDQGLQQKEQQVHPFWDGQECLEANRANRRWERERTRKQAASVQATVRDF